MKRTIFLLSLLLLASFVYSQDSTFTTSPAKEKPQSSSKDKIYYGGNVGLNFGNYTRIGVYPLIGYKVTPKFSIGVKLGYEYISDKRYSTTYTTSNYGGSVFSRYRIVPPLYAHVEFAGVNYELYDIDGQSKREWVPFLYVGGGYSQSLGGNAWLNVQVLFDVLNHDKSPYSSWQPVYSVGVGVGF